MASKMVCSEACSRGGTDGLQLGHEVEGDRWGARQEQTGVLAKTKRFGLGA
jgi:hypothetical protein